MDNVWFFKHCPQCGNYLKKRDPQESAMCCSCGWQEYVVAFYCEFRGRFCSEDEFASSLPAKILRTPNR